VTLAGAGVLGFCGEGVTRGWGKKMGTIKIVRVVQLRGSIASRIMVGEPREA
jgi:hypothetical protein